MMDYSEKARRHYTPLNISKSLVCSSAGSPLMQTTDGTNFFPDRSVVQTCIQPLVEATSSDGSWPNKRSNVYLTNMVWYCNEGNVWQDISKVQSWKDLYSIDNTDSITRGSLYVKRNFTANDKQSVYFEADLLDYRTKKLTHITTDPVTLSTVKKGADTYGMGIGCDSNITYNPFNDKLALYEYKVANGLQVAADATRNACMDGNQYLKTIPIDVYLSKKRITSGYAIKVYRVDNVGKQSEIAASTADKPTEIVSLSLTSMVIDLRMYDKCDYILKAVVGGKVVAQYQFNTLHIYPTLKFDFANKSRIRYGQMERVNRLIVHCQSKVVEYPARILKINWKTIAHNDDGTDIEHVWQEGDTCQYNILDTGLGENEQCELEDKVECEYKDTFDYATDNDGSVFVDEKGEPLLID